jgi:hypothetical protein
METDREDYRCGVAIYQLCPGKRKTPALAGVKPILIDLEFLIGDLFSIQDLTLSLSSCF